MAHKGRSKRLGGGWVGSGNGVDQRHRPARGRHSVEYRGANRFSAGDRSHIVVGGDPETRPITSRSVHHQTLMKLAPALTLPKGWTMREGVLRSFRSCMFALAATSIGWMAACGSVSSGATVTPDGSLGSASGLGGTEGSRDGSGGSSDGNANIGGNETAGVGGDLGSGGRGQAGGSMSESGAAGTSEGGDASTGMTCDPSTPFSAPREVPELNGPLDQCNPTLTADELTVYFASDREHDASTPDFDIYVATRQSRTASFGAPKRVDEVSSPADDRGPMISPDGLRLYFHSSRGGNYDIWTSTRADVQSAFSTPTPVSGVNSTAIDEDPWIREDGQVLYFYSERDMPSLPGGIYRSTLGPAGFQQPTRVSELGDGTSPVVSADDLTIYFGSARGNSVANDVDVWMAHRTSAGDGFGTPTKVTELRSPTFDFPTWLSHDHCRLYMWRDYRILMADR
jgi:hypothetical protein